ncbi:rhodanese-like domain-containing protein [Massilibacteroides vaginae]|uniref:rhodanese-like domain-containing protein n=1 Tax=Massilibacteroides vaginae TaxID=1673718 RepID=UPI000A1C9DAE|nr:rhodanese-like domain-containing protein [Massilibacteroides vaginae]
MFNFLKTIMSPTSPEKLKELIGKGAELIDVRTREEYDEDHVAESRNIPLDEVALSLAQFDKEKTYVVVCVSGRRSGEAVNILKKEGFMNVHNGGSWNSFLE